ncbi:MAG: 3-hydroxyacyl-CoA dehydrogenase family protein [Candidatus Competibacterales bacterium]
MIILPIRRVAVLGCGAMGRQMAALCANAGLEVDLFGLPRPNGAPGHQACQALETLRSAWPPPLACPEAAHAINPCDYAHHLDHLRRCDLVVEAVAEQRDTKLGFLARIVPHLQRWTLIATTTESLSVAELALALPEGLRERFCGVHCFLPLRYRTLVELVPGERTDPRVLDALEDFCVTVLGRDVVRAFDRSISMAERIDLFATASALHYTQAFDLLPEAVDALAGPFIERPLARIERRGWDDFTRRLARAHATLADDPWRERFTLPSGLVHHLAAAEEAIHRVEGGVTRVFDLKAGRHPPALSPAVSAPQPEDGGLDLEQQPFTWALWRDVCHYCAHHLADLAPCARHVDHALRLGAGWPLGPFEHWQQLGWQTVAKAIAADIEAGDTPVALPLPSWALAIDAVHTPRGSYAPERRRHCPRSSLACYRRQDRVLPWWGRPQCATGCQC